jgi:hypothetical protein
MGELLKQILVGLLTNPAVIITAVLGVVALILRTAVHRRRVLWVGQQAYLGVESLKAQYREEGKDTAVLDKIGEGLRIATEYMLANKWGELSDADRAALKLQFTSMHGAAKLAVQQLAVAKAVPIALPH